MADSADERGSSSYGQILKSSALIGSAQAIVLAITIVRTKVMAMWLGPAGFGLMALYTSIVDLAHSIASLGVDRSGVREIAASVGTGDRGQIARTAEVVRRITWALGLAGAVLLAAVSPLVSKLTFGDDTYAWAVALLSIAVLFKVVSGGQAALLQGVRRVGDLAVLGVVGALGGTLVALIVVYAFGEAAIAHAVIAVTAATLCASWWYSRRVRAGFPTARNIELKRDSLALVKLGMAFMASGFLMLGAAYAVRAMIIRFDTLQAAGYYQAAWALGSLYVGTILQAMGTDFYPRLTAAISDHTTANRLVNEQTHVSVLLAGPGVIATVALGSWLLTLFYTADFVAAADILYWICLGMTLRIITWPIGYIIVAAGRQTIFFATEAAWATFNVLASWFCIKRFGPLGAGIAFFASYVFHWIIVYPIVRHMTGFRWTGSNMRIGGMYLALIAVVFAATQTLSQWPALAVGGIAFAISAAYSLRSLVRLVPAERFPAPLRRLPSLIAGK